MNIFLLTYLIRCLILSSPEVTENLAPKVYPVPPANENSLFYIQRTKNTNAIVYETNRGPDGKIIVDDPIKIFWIRYSSDSSTEDLSAIQRKYAYGVTSRSYNGQKNAFVIQFVAYKKKNIFLLPKDNGKKYVAYVNINGKLAELKRIFVATNGGTFWFPTIEYVELSGKDPASQQVIVERFKP
jgi:hypothetical protein